MVEPYAVEFRPEALGNLKRFSKFNAQRILNKIRWLADNFDAISHEALTGEFKGLFKLRVGDYRVIYSVVHKEKLIIIHLVGHRRNIYERR
jgi:mRNA interferase RelE/StbE